MIRLSTLSCTTFLSTLTFALAGPATAATDINLNELMNLSLEQLSNLEVTSVSKRSEKANEAAAAIFVITQDDIRRGGFTTIPETLRMVPGLNVAQAGSHLWAISARGFNDHFANKLLVLLDGRTVYTPLFSGVYWDVQDTLIEDIERIEVIRGPGATLWGANAVNGVINIITKSAKNTQGGLAGVTVGSQEHLIRTRYGTKIGDNAHIRTYAKYDDRDALQTLTDTEGTDPWNKSQAGFRADWNGDDTHSFTVQGDMYRAGEDVLLGLPILSPPYSNSVYDRELARGGNILGRWNFKQSKESDFTFQLYYDNVQRKNFVYSDSRHTFDLDFQHVWLPHQDHEVVWGSGYRLIDNNIDGTDYLIVSPSRRKDSLFSAFVQDKITLLPQELFFTVGSKFEHNEYTGFEYQPSGRFSWLVEDNQTVWGSVAHAIRTPNRFSDDGSLILAPYPPSGPVAFLGTVGNPNLESEEMNAFELGYRIQPTPQTSLDIATFYNDYSNLVIGSLGDAIIRTSENLGTYAFLPVTPINANKARSFGFETSAKWDVTPDLQLAAGYSFIDLKFDQRDSFGFDFTGKEPQQQFNLRSAWMLPHDLELNSSFYYVDSLTGISVGDYIRFDTRLAWKPIESLEVSIVGQNLLDPEHQEFTGYVYQNAAQIPRSFYGNILWKF